MNYLLLFGGIEYQIEFNKEEYFEAADPDSIIEIRSISIKDWRKKQKRKLTKRLKENSKSKNPFVRIIYTPMTNG